MDFGDQPPRENFMDPETWIPTTVPSTNADGLPIVPMTHEQKFVFDLKGWLLLPDLLTQDQVAAIREHIHKVQREPDSLPPHLRHYMAGPSQVMLDHPVIVGILSELIGHATVASEECYGFRF